MLKPSTDKVKNLLFIADFEDKLAAIETIHKRWFSNHCATNAGTRPDSIYNYVFIGMDDNEYLQFEIFNTDALPSYIRKDFFDAVRSCFMKAA